MFKKSIICLFSILVILACSGITKQKFPLIAYSTISNDLHDLERKYKNIRIYRSQDLSTFVIDAKPLDKSYYGQSTQSETLYPYGLVSAQVFISETGQVESIIIIESDHPALIQYAKSAIMGSKFKPLKFGKQSYEPYSFFIKYYIPDKFSYYADYMRYPIINGVNTKEPHEFKGKTHIYEDWEVDEPASFLYFARPVFPQDQFTHHFLGLTGIELIVDETGKVADVRVTYSRGRLDEYSVDAAWKCRLRPARVKGIPVKSRKRISYSYR